MGAQVLKLSHPLKNHTEALPMFPLKCASLSGEAEKDTKSLRLQGVFRHLASIIAILPSGEVKADCPHMV